MMKILKFQHWHILILSTMLIMMFYIINSDFSFIDGDFLNIDTKIWLIISIVIPILHQLYVLICWRSELFYKGISKLFGNTDRAFKVFKIGFAILFVSRLISIILLALSNSNSFEANRIIIYIILIIISLPTVYLFYSVKTYFGIDRAFGLDHFKPDDIKNKPFVKRGIFKYTSNGMYIYGFLILWIPGLVMMSKVALIVALFNHLYIWTHYYFTELPDIKLIYKK